MLYAHLTPVDKRASDLGGQRCQLAHQNVRLESVQEHPACQTRTCARVEEKTKLNLNFFVCFVPGQIQQDTNRLMECIRPQGCSTKTAGNNVPNPQKKTHAYIPQYLSSPRTNSRMEKSHSPFSTILYEHRATSNIVRICCGRRLTRRLTRPSEQTSSVCLFRHTSVRIALGMIEKELRELADVYRRVGPSGRRYKRRPTRTHNRPPHSHDIHHP